METNNTRCFTVSLKARWNPSLGIVRAIWTSPCGPWKLSDCGFAKTSWGCGCETCDPENGCGSGPCDPENGSRHANGSDPCDHVNGCGCGFGYGGHENAIDGGREIGIGIGCEQACIDNKQRQSAKYKLHMTNRSRERLRLRRRSRLLLRYLRITAHKQTKSMTSERSQGRTDGLSVLPLATIRRWRCLSD